MPVASGRVGPLVKRDFSAFTGERKERKANQLSSDLCPLDCKAFECVAQASSVCELECELIDLFKQL